MNLRPALLALALLAPSAFGQEVAEDPNLEGRGPDLTFGGLVQTQFNTSDADDADDTQLALRRVRLSANARVSDLVSGRIQAELANAATGGSAELNEAYALFQFAPAVGVLVGKGGRPFGIIDATAATRLVPIERGARFRGAEAVELYRTLEALAYAGRSVGVQVLGEVPGLPVGVVYAAGYFSGSTGEEGTDADIHQLAARLQVQPAPWLKVGLAATSRAFAQADPPGVEEGGGASGADPQGETRRGGGYALDVEVGEYGQAGFHALGEVVTGTLDPFRDSEFWAAQGWVAYRLGGLEAPTGGVLVAVEPLFRVSTADVDGALGAFQGTLLTPGLNLCAARNTRLALNLDVFLPDEADDRLVAFRSQVQIVF